MLDMTMNIIISAAAAAIVIIVHEASKYYFSLTLMHPIYRKRADNKIKVLKYIDPIGLILFVFTGVGWQKPAEYNLNKFKDKEKGLLILSFVGIAANVIVILLFIPIFISNPFKGNSAYNYFVIFLYKLIQFSFALIIVNLLPVPPFDMSKVIYALNPSYYFKMIQNERVIHAVFILLIAFGILGKFVDSLFYPIQQLLGI